jgi:predicted DNA-binding transcriptional regulator AlpA
MTTPNSSGVRFMSRRQVLEATTLSYPMIWRKMREGKFPRGREVDGRTCWLASEIEEWILSRPVKRLKPATATNLTTKNPAAD